MKETKPTYKKQGNIGLFDSEETMEKGLYKEKFTKVGAKPYD